MVKRFEEFEEIVGELGTKYNVDVDPKVIVRISEVVERDLKDLAAKKSLSVRGVQAYFKKVYEKVWYLREPLGSVDELIVKKAKKLGLDVPSEVRTELNRLYTSLTADTLFAAGAYVVLTRGRKRNPGSATVTEEDAEKVCKDFLLMPKPHWLC